ncbi:MAG: phenylacetic acid degradation protein, partial [Anaerolineales bacterium]
MSDTQWPAFYVFKQDREGEPHENVGTVHAPDAELALLNARDVFVRRPECVSLWVAPESQVTSRTVQELGAGSPADEPGGPEAEYRVFKKVQQRGSHVHAGSVRARSPIEA